MVNRYEVTSTLKGMVKTHGRWIGEDKFELQCSFIRESKHTRTVRTSIVMLLLGDL